MRPVERFCLAMALFMAIPLWSQTENPPTQQPAPTSGASDKNSTPDNTQDNSQDNSVAPTVADDRMLTPPVVSGANYPTALTSEERSNYLRAGVAFTGAYTDNAVGAVNGGALSDVSYSLAPTVALDKTTERLHWILNYAPGFTFYQRETSRDEVDQNASINFQYRLSPHVTFTASDVLQKSSSAFNNFEQVPDEAVSGGTQGSNLAIVAPIANLLRNSGNIGINYQFSLNGMLGASGTFSNLHYPDPAQVPGLFDSATQGGSVFYSIRASKLNYFGLTYQYSRLVSYATGGLDETQTHAILFFYTLYPSTHFSISFFGGPQYSDTVQPPSPPLNLVLPASKAWTPAVGGSFSWQGRLNSLAVSVSHIISGGGGLVGAVKQDTASIAGRQQITRTFSASLGGGYSQNDILAGVITGGNSGHSLSATASLQQRLGPRMDLQVGYTRLHQAYSNVAVLSTAPDTNREYVSISYQFSRPLGR
jgi:hypothetical protein